MAALDFTVGRNCWGHAMHGQTMRQVRPARMLDRLKDRLQKAYRVSVMVHSPRFPQAGDDFLWTAAAGHTVRAKVYAVNPRIDPRDMYTVFVRVAATPAKGESKHED